MKPNLIAIALALLPVTCFVALRQRQVSEVAPAHDAALEGSDAVYNEGLSPSAPGSAAVSIHSRPMGFGASNVVKARGSSGKFAAISTPSSRQPLIMMEAAVDAEVRSRRDVSSPVLRNLRAGDRVLVRNSNGTWAEVPLSRNQNGFVLSTQVQPVRQQELGGAPAPAVAAQQAGPANGEPPAAQPRLPYLGPEEGHWIKRISNGGRTIVLEDDSVWQVDAGDELNTSGWTALDEITVKESPSASGGYSLTNVTHDKSVGARYAGRA